MVTLRSGLRAYCTYSRGADFWMIERGRPRGKRMRVPFTSAPAFFHSSIASGSSRNSMPIFLQDGVGIVLDDLQPLLAQHLVDRDLAGR